LTIQAGASIFASGDTAKRDDYFVSFAPINEPITALRLEALPDERLPARGPGTTYYEGTLGDFYLTELRAKSPTADFPFASASETYSKNRYCYSPQMKILKLRCFDLWPTASFNTAWGNAPGIRKTRNFFGQRPYSIRVGWFEYGRWPKNDLNERNFQR